MCVDVMTSWRASLLKSSVVKVGIFSEPTGRQVKKLILILCPPSAQNVDHDNN